LATRCRLRAECNLVQLRHQLDPNKVNAQRVRDVISLLEEYGGFADRAHPGSQRGFQAAAV